MLVHRIDVGARLRADMRTHQGGAKIPARLSRTGVQSYPQEDGTVRREYRPPSEVFAEQSMKTFDTATVVEGHPATIDPTNWKDHAVGDLRAIRKEDGKYVGADLIIRDAATLAKIDSGELQEISCGYDCMLEMTAGVSAEGEKYDAIQRQISINHVGLGPANWGRAGSEVRLRLDGGIVAYAEDESARRRPPSMTDEEIKALKEQAAADKARADAAEAKLGSKAGADLAKVEAQRDEALATAKKLAEASDPARIDAIVAGRVAVLDGARLLHGKDVAAKGTEREIMVAAIQARDSEFTADGKSDDYVRARFDVKVEDAKRADAALGDLNRGTSPRTLEAGGGAGGTGDKVLDELCRKFDAAPKALRAYHLSDPWLYGEQAASEAARKAV